MTKLQSDKVTKKAKAGHSEKKPRGQKTRAKETPQNIKPWLANKIKRARDLSKHRAARAAGRWGAPAGVGLVVLLTLFSFFSHKTEFHLLQERLAKNPNDFEAHLQLAEKFLENNQLKEAEKALLLAQRIRNYELRITHNVLGETTEEKLEELWERKHYADPKDIRRLIAAWKEIMEGKPDYRDGWIQLAVLHYKLYENEKAKECLNKALELDPNFGPARELENLLTD